MSRTAALPKKFWMGAVALCLALPGARIAFAATSIGTNITTDGTVTATGLVTANGGLTVVGGVALPTGAIDSSEIANGTIVNADLAAGTFGGITGTGTLTAGATGAGFTVNFGASTVSGQLSIANGGTGTGTAPTDGQVLIGKTDGSYAVATLSAGSGISITNGNGTISIAATSASAPFTDAVALVQGSGDTTKRVRFEVDGLTTSTTRILTVPDADMTLVGEAFAQALTNKTIAAGSNTITGITNANMTAGSFGNITGVGTLGALSLNGVLTLQNGETIDAASDAAFMLGRNTSGTVTLTAKDDDAVAALTILPGGAAGLALGGGSMTGLTVTTDGAGDAEVVLPNESIGSAEILNGSIVNGNLAAGTFGAITGTGPLTAGATGAGFTLALDASTSTGTLEVANGGTGAATAAAARTNIGAATTYQNQTVKTTAKVWNGTATTTSGVATFNPTDDNTGSGNAIFTTIYSVTATAATNTSTAIAVPVASVKLIAADKKSVTVNVVVGQNIPALSAADSFVFAPNGTAVYLTIIGD